ncbi:MAG: GMC family oxidoreductase N-terminal domain-containing protein [Acidithiobacillales bacterium]
MSLKPEILGAFVELQLSCLSPAGGPVIDDPNVVAAEVIDYLESVPGVLTDAIGLILDHVDAVSRVTAGGPFAAQPPGRREDVLNRLWNDPLWHDLVSLVARVTWLVIYSREPARQEVGFSLPPNPPAPVDLPPPVAARLDTTYDVCVIGSGAGGAVTAARLAEAGRNVLLVEEGPWVSPKDHPVRDDRALALLYRNSGLKPAWPEAGRIFRKHGVSFITVLQGRVVGGGPTVNNAIHLPIDKARWQEWRDEFDFPVDWPDFDAALQTVAADLGVSTAEMRSAMGQRSAAFEAGANALHLPVRDLPLSVRSCIGCGGCNVGCRFGLKTGGLHGPRPAGAVRSYLERALAAGVHVRANLSVDRFEPKFLTRRVAAAVCADLAGGDHEVAITADSFVLAAGPIAASNILRRSAFQILSPVGKNISANVVTPVFALLDHEILPGEKNPGIQMCVFVDQGGRLLESWFHYPGSLAASLPGWLRDHANVMKAYRRLAVCAVVVPTGNHGEVGLGGDLVLSLSDAELAQMKEGVVAIADAFFAGGALAAFPATMSPFTIRRDHRDEDAAAFRQLVAGPADLAQSTAHPQGGNALGRSSAKCVVTPDFHLFDFDNLFVADTSLFPAGCFRNPQMTTMALAHLAAARV